MIGGGLSRQHFSKSDLGYTYYTFRPSLSVSYPVFKGARIRYNFSVSPSLPSLASLSDIVQQQTDVEISRGNANLQPYRSYMNRLTFSWKNKFLTTQLNGSYTYSKNPIMEDVSRTNTDENDYGYLFVYGLDNQKNYSRWNGQLYVRANLIEDILILSTYGGVNSYKSRGNTYSHTYDNWYGGVSLIGNYKNFTLTGSVNSRANSLWGETIEIGEKYSRIECSYSKNNLSLGVGILYPFSSKGWDAADRKISELVKKEAWTCIRDNGNMVTLSLSWSFNSGRKHAAGRKSLNNADYDSGIAK